MDVGDQVRSTMRPPPPVYEVVRGAVVGLLVGSAAGAATALAIGLGVRPLDLASSGGLALAVVVLGMGTPVLEEPEGVVPWAMVMGASAAAATPWIRRGT